MPLFFFLHCGESGRERGKDEVFASAEVNETGTYSYYLKNVSKDSIFYKRIVTCSSFKSMYGGPWYGRWKNSRFSYKCFIVL